MNAETYWQRFRLEIRKLTENFGEPLTDLLGCWERAAEGMELRELVLLEQFLQALLKDMAIRVREGKPKTTKEASEMVDNYELARKADRGGAVQQQQQGLDQTSNASSGAPAGKMKPQDPPPRAGPGVQRSKTSSRGDILCWECGRYHNIAISCPNRKTQGSGRSNCQSVLMATQHLGNPLALRKGQLDGKDVQVLLDTGSEMSIARASLVDPVKWSQETVRVQCIFTTSLMASGTL